MEKFDVVITPKTGWFEINIKELWRYKDLIGLFVKRNYISQYKQTILGPAWAIIQPLLTTIIFTIILLASVTSVFSANTTLTIKGTDNVTIGGTGKLTVQLTSSDVIGGVMGVISKNSNITNIEIVGKNGWNVGAFNKETGSFNIIKNEGASNEEIFEIQYTVSNSTGTGKIDIKDITVSNVQDYEEEEVQAIS